MSTCRYKRFARGRDKDDGATRVKFLLENSSRSTRRKNCYHSLVWRQKASNISRKMKHIFISSASFFFYCWLCPVYQYPIWNMCNVLSLIEEIEFHIVLVLLIIFLPSHLILRHVVMLSCAVWRWVYSSSLRQHSSCYVWFLKDFHCLKSQKRAQSVFHTTKKSFRCGWKIYDFLLLYFSQFSICCHIRIVQQKNQLKTFIPSTFG